jgi:low temperature requirement protein LtrA
VVGNGLYKRVVYGRFPLSHCIGLALLALLAPFAFHTDLLMTGGLTTVVMVVVAAWESVSRRTSAQGEQVVQAD